MDVTSRKDDPSSPTSGCGGPIRRRKGVGGSAGGGEGVPVGGGSGDLIGVFCSWTRGRVDALQTGNVTRAVYYLRSQAALCTPLLRCYPLALCVLSVILSLTRPGRSGARGWGREIISVRSSFLALQPALGWRDGVLLVLSRSKVCENGRATTKQPLACSNDLYPAQRVCPCSLPELSDLQELCWRWRRNV